MKLISLTNNCVAFFFIKKLNIPFKRTIMLTVLLTGDMLGGHLDDMEKDWSKPIVSIRYCDSFSSYFVVLS